MEICFWQKMMNKTRHSLVQRLNNHFQRQLYIVLLFILSTTQENLLVFFSSCFLNHFLSLLQILVTQSLKWKTKQKLPYYAPYVEETNKSPLLSERNKTEHLWHFKLNIRVVYQNKHRHLRKDTHQHKSHTSIAHWNPSFLCFWSANILRKCVLNHFITKSSRHWGAVDMGLSTVNFVTPLSVTAYHQSVCHNTFFLNSYII